MILKKIFVFLSVLFLFGSLLVSFVFAKDVDVIAINYKYDFIVIDKGQMHGIKDDDIFYITKNAFQIGKVQVKKAQTDVAACDVIGLVEGAELKLGEKISLVSEPMVSEGKIKYRWKDITPPKKTKGEKEDTTIAEFKGGEGSVKNKEVQKKQFAILQAKARELAEKEIEEKKKLLVTFNFKNADINNVLRIISREKKLNIIAGGDVKEQGGDVKERVTGIKGRVTASFKNVSVYKALNAILQSLGFTYVKEDGIVKIIPLTKSEINTRSFIYQPKYKRVENLKASIKDMLTKKGKILVDRIAEHYTKGEDTEDEDTEEVKSPYGTSNQMMIIDTPSNLKRIKKFVKKLDVPPKQVMIEAKFVDVQLEDSKELGVSWGIESTSTEAPEPRMSMVYEGREGLGIFKYGSIGTTQLSATISALKEKKDVDILSEPSITTLNNKTATFSLDRYLAYYDVEIIDTDTGTRTEYPWTELDEDKRPGIKLDVTPFVTIDDKILLKVTPQATILKEFLESPQGSRYPVVTKRKVETEVLVPNGHTLVIGGLIEKSKTKQRRGVPFLSDIPILGIPFRNTYESFSRRELMIFITPRIVNSKDPGGSSR